jgi:N-acetylmuramic acid 6-phosphate etherase
MSYENNVEEFLKVKNQFQLGNLVTESSHPATVSLSALAQKDLSRAVQTLKNVDLMALEKFKNAMPQLKSLHLAVKDTIETGGRIFLCGCGATGRLSLVLEFIWKWTHKTEPFCNRVIGFMAGGDVALIASIEKFEDFPEYGARQLKELEFGENDLFIGATEGGETPFVIGATEEASKRSKRKPFFLYCNPDELLTEKILRSRHVIKNPSIEKINLTVGPMAITGSTRMQASTALMYAIGLCLDEHGSDFLAIEKRVLKFIKKLESTDLSFLEEFIEKESEIYGKNELVFYDTTAEFGITVLTDTTERSPTFSLHPFENIQDSIKNPSLCYLLFQDSKNSEEAWAELLQRPPRTFHWEEVTSRTSYERLEGFDFSKNAMSLRQSWHGKKSRFFTIARQSDGLLFNLEDKSHLLDLGDLDFLEQHLLLKMILNTLSTAIMGRMSRYDGNVMTWVRSSNYKLIDRTIRYVSMILRQNQIEVPYDEIARKIFEIKDKVPSDRPLVVEVANYYKKIDKK